MLSLATTTIVSLVDTQGRGDDFGTWKVKYGLTPETGADYEANNSRYNGKSDKKTMNPKMVSVQMPNNTNQQNFG